MIDHLLESSLWDDSNKWSNIGFGEQIGILEITRPDGIKDGFSGLDLILTKEGQGQGQGQKVNRMLKRLIQLSNWPNMEVIQWWLKKKEQFNRKVYLRCTCSDVLPPTRPPARTLSS